MRVLVFFKYCVHLRCLHYKMHHVAGVEDSASMLRRSITERLQSVDSVDFRASAG